MLPENIDLGVKTLLINLSDKKRIGMEEAQYVLDLFAKFPEFDRTSEAEKLVEQFQDFVGRVGFELASLGRTHESLKRTLAACEIMVSLYNLERQMR